MSEQEGRPVDFLTYEQFRQRADFEDRILGRRRVEPVVDWRAAEDRYEAEAQQEAIDAWKRRKAARLLRRQRRIDRVAQLIRRAARR